MTSELPAEVDERIAEVLSSNWSAEPAQAVPVNDSTGRYNVWRTVFKCLEFDGPEGKEEAMRTIELDVLGRTLEDLLVVARRLDQIADALRFSWRVSIEATVDGTDAPPDAAPAQ